MSPIIYILYNANANALGKVDYAFRKLTSSADNSPCSACDLTHGGLRLTETKDWAATKKRIPAEVWQLHRDEAPQEILDFVKANGARYPCVLGRRSEAGELQVVMSSDQLKETSKDHELFLSRLVSNAAEKGIQLGSKGSV